MNREIEFRGFDSREWRYGDLEYNRKNDVARIHTYKDDDSYNKQYLVDPYTVCEFTGMRDKHGKKIFEGDIVRTNGCEEFFEVIYDAPDFCLKKNSSGYRFLNHPENFEVIGNIYDNPELLTKTK